MSLIWKGLISWSGLLGSNDALDNWHEEFHYVESVNWWRRDGLFKHGGSGLRNQKTKTHVLKAESWVEIVRRDCWISVRRRFGTQKEFKNNLWFSHKLQMRENECDIRWMLWPQDRMLVASPSCRVVNARYEQRLFIWKVFINEWDLNVWDPNEHPCILGMGFNAIYGVNVYWHVKFKRVLTLNEMKCSVSHYIKTIYMMNVILWHIL